MMFGLDAACNELTNQSERKSRRIMDMQNAGAARGFRASASRLAER